VIRAGKEAGPGGNCAAGSVLGAALDFCEGLLKSKLHPHEAILKSNLTQQPLELKEMP